MVTAQLLLRRASSLLLRRKPVHSSLFQPRAAMAADATTQFQKIQIQREDTVTTPPSLTCSLVWARAR